jgi:hypothetical protein
MAVWSPRLPPDTAVYSPRKGEFINAKDDGPVDGTFLVVLAWQAIEPARCTRLLAWARAQAAGQSTADFCRQMGTTRKLIYRSAEDVATWLNARSDLTRATEIVS